MRRSVFILMFAIGLSFLSNVVFGENVVRGVRVIVIDAGHGGPKYPGAHYGGINEKDINLQVALRLGALIEKGLPDVKVVYTRKKDMQFSSVLTEDLQARADIANKADGDLFISIHSNAIRNTVTHGTETLIMGETPMETRVNNAALYDNNKEELIDMSDSKTAAIVRAYIQNLQFTYGERSEFLARMIQKHYVALGRATRGVRKQPLKVLYATNMPSVLTEIGFMTNAQELKYITSAKGQEAIAGAIFAAIKDYIAYVHKAQALDSTPAVREESREVAASTTDSEKQSGAEAQNKQEAQSEPAKQDVAEKPAATAKQGRIYAIQILASAKHLAADDSQFGQFRNKVAECRGEGGFPYKYCVGNYPDKATALVAVEEVRKSFPSAFVVAVENGCTVADK